MHIVPSRLGAKIRESAIWQSIAEQKAGLIVCLVALISYLGFYLTFRAAQMPGNSDPHYIWLFARSLVYDHDFDFTNDYRLCGDPFALGTDHGTHHPENPYYVGPTLFLAPALLFFRGIMSIPGTAPPAVLAACRGPIAGLSMSVGCVLGAVTLFLSYRMARRFTTDGVAAVATALFGWSGLLAAYSGMWPNYSHSFSTFGVALVAMTTMRATEKSESWWRWGAVALAVAIGTWQRPSQLLYGFVPLAAAVWKCRRERQRLVKITALLASGGALGTIPLLFLYKYLYGSYLANPMGDHYLHLAHAHPFLVLFAPHGGLFFVTPVAWVAVVGLFFAWRHAEMRRFLWPLVVVGAVEAYLNSAALDWHGAGTFGARRLTSLTPLFILLTAAFLDKLAVWLEERPQRALVALSIAITVPMGAWTHGMMLGQSRGTIPCCSGASQADLYGEGSKAMWRVFDDGIGDLAVLPASLLFSARYRLPANRFRDATEPRFYVRNFRQHSFIAHGFSFADATLVSDGLVRNKHGATLGRRGRVIFAAEWPFATKLTLSLHANAPGHLRVGFGQTFGVKWIGTIDIGPDIPGPHVLPIPPGVFDSGIVEMVFELDGAETSPVELDHLQFDDEAAD